MKNTTFAIVAFLCRFVLLASGTGGDGRIPPLDGAVTWLNSAPLSDKALRGKVVLSTSGRTPASTPARAPWLKAWDEKYRNAGLVVIGVHTPEFGLEKEPANVKKAIVDCARTEPVTWTLTNVRITAAGVEALPHVWSAPVRRPDDTSWA